MSLLKEKTLTLNSLLNFILFFFKFCLILAVWELLSFFYVVRMWFDLSMCESNFSFQIQLFDSFLSNNYYFLNVIFMFSS